MSAELRFETISDEPHAAIAPITELFRNELLTPLPVVLIGSGYRLYTATKELELVGAANVCIDFFEDLAYIRKLAVNPEHRNQGIGSALLRYTMDDIRKSGTPKAAICPSNDNNRRLYERLGFNPDPTFDGNPSWLFKDLRQPEEA